MNEDQDRYIDEKNEPIYEDLPKKKVYFKLRNNDE